MGDELPKVRVAAVQAAPVFLDRERTTEKACELIRDAGRQDVDVIVFPEGFIPCHPVWYHFLPASQPRAVGLATELFRNAVVVGGAETQALGQAARDAGAWVLMGVCEKEAGTTGTMWNSIVYLSPDGDVVRVHRKLAPTTVERLVHTGGVGSDLEAVQTPFGPITGLLCGENSNPLLVFSALAQSSILHAAMWPHHFSRKDGPTLSMRDVILTNAQSLAYQIGSFVCSVGGTLDDSTRERIAETDEDLAWLTERRDFGGSCIVAPSGKILAGPLGGDEETLIADLELERVIPKKLMHDYAGHYTRRDVFHVDIADDPSPLLEAPWTRGASAARPELDIASRPTEVAGTESDEFVVAGSNGSPELTWSPDLAAPVHIPAD